MAVLTVISPDLNGEAVVPATASAGGDTFAAQVGGTYLVHLRNGHSSAQTVTFDDPTSATPSEATAFNPDVTVSVPQTAERIIRVQASRFRNSDGVVSMTYSGVVSLTISVYRA